MSRLAKSTRPTISKDYSDDHGLWCDGFCCMHNPKNLYYNGGTNHA